MRVSAKADYAVRAAVELASLPTGQQAKGDQIAVNQEIPPRFLDAILSELRKNDIVEGLPGPNGGYSLSRAPETITVGEVINAVEGPIASVRGDRPDQLAYRGSARPLQGVWLALRANVRTVLEAVTLADVVAGALPEPVLGLSAHPQATAADLPAVP